MPKKLICCDGTGNEVSASEYTNVVKLYRRLRKQDPLGKQHNSLLPVWWLLGWWTRDIDPLRIGRPVWIHESVRIRRENDARFDRKCERQIREPFEYVKTTQEIPRPNTAGNYPSGG